ncbi:hypothetical protein OESDEN_00149 [Oesophagostomum dentatum]|uniref:aralkylamine N-acetyltransferase n=1 Tax=Oesophagostomum dentatum TaxID=61180 RepID=A0A0B1TWM8_OESDE|nr:hypothetical protein OESDEN_00149 [Oesophagostomum dentatum]
MDDKNIAITTGQLSDKSETLEFLAKYFLKDEPMNQAAKIEASDFLPIANVIATRCLRTPFSAIARDTETKEIVGVALNSVWRRGDEENAYYNTKTRTDDLARAHDTIMNEIHSSFWKLAPNDVSTVLHSEISSVSPHYRRRGIASRLYNKCLESKENVKTFDISGIVAEATSIANQQLLKKQGYEVLREILYANYRGANGEVLLKPADGSKSVALQWKRL